MYVQHTFWINVSAHIQEEEARQVAFINQLREPAHRLASAFAWNRALCCGTRPPDWCGGGLVNRQQQLGACRKGVSLDAVWSLLRAQQRFDRCLPCRYLCGAHAGSIGCAAQAACSHDSACEHSVEEVEWSALLSNAKERLSTSFAVVGIIEDLPSTLAVLAARLPTFFGPPLNMSQYIRTRLNANGNHDANQSTGSLEWARLEQQLYSHAKVRLATQLASCRHRDASSEEAALPYGTRKSLWDADHQDLRKVVERICVFPSRSVDFTFGSCGSSAAADPISMTTGFECSRQWRALKSCLLVRAQKMWEDVAEGATKRHDSLARKLSGRRVAVVGDSMGRQSFVALVSLLRNQSYWVDGSFGDSYVLQRSLGGQILDVLGMRGQPPQVGRELPPRTELPQWGHAAAQLLNLTKQRAHANQLVVNYFTSTCYDIPQSLKMALTIDRYDLLVLHLPAFWPMMSMCNGKHARLHDLVAKNLSHPEGAVHLFWTSLSELASRHKTRVVVVSAPTENIPGQYRKGTQAVIAANSHAQVLAPALSFSFVDWDARLRKLAQPAPHVVPNDWHFGCSIGPVGGDRMPRNRWQWATSPGLLRIDTLTSGDCTDQGNTLLWTQLIPSVLQTVDAAVDGASWRGRSELRGA